MTTNSISLNRLSKRYRGTGSYALRDLSLDVAPGEVYGFLGANGAGKSTTIRLLVNFIQPTSGSGQVLGMDIVRDSLKIRQHVGYLAGDVALYNKVTGKEFLDFMTTLQPIKHQSYVDSLANNLEAQLNKPLRALSKGNRQKIGILQAFMHEPDVLILDEPTSGLDPLMQEVFFDAVRDAKQRGASVFFSSHNLAEVQRICDRVSFIREGQMVSEQRISELMSGASHTFEIDFAGKPPLKDLRAISGATITASSGSQHVTAVVPVDALPSFFGVLSKAKIARFQQQELNLEDEFLNFYREDQHHDDK